MFDRTHTDESPWYVINADVKKHARLNCISHLLGQVEYEDTMPEPTELPARQQDPSYERPAIDGQNWVPALYGSNPTASDVERS